MKLRRHAIVTLLTAMTAGLLASSAPAFADDDGGDPVVITTAQSVSLSGTITSTSPLPAGITVSAYAPATFCFDQADPSTCLNYAAYVDGTIADPATGAFTLTVPANSKIWLNAMGDPIYANSYGRTPSTSPANPDSGTAIQVGDSDISGLDIAVLTRPGISGTITVPSAALALALGAGASVTFYRYFEPKPQPGVDHLAGKWVQVDRLEIDQSALATAVPYTKVLDPGTYRVAFESYWTGTTFHGGTSLDTAADVVVSGEGFATADLAATMLPLAQGTVTPPSGATLDQGMYAVLFRADQFPSASSETDDTRYALINADGSFAFPVTTPADYLLVAVGANMYGFFGAEPDCFPTKGFDKTCPPPSVAIGADGASGLDFTLRWFPKVTGTVTLPEGFVAADVQASLQRWQENPGMDEGDEPWWEWNDVRGETLVDNEDGTASVSIRVTEPGTYRVLLSGPWVLPLSIGGDEENGPDASAFVVDSITAPDQSFTVDVEAAPTISGTVDPAIFAGKRVVAKVVVWSEDEEFGDWWEQSSWYVDMGDGSFILPAQPGDYRLSIRWIEADEDGQILPEASWSEMFLGGPRITRARDIMLNKASVGEVYFTFPEPITPDAPASTTIASVGDGSVTVGWSAPEFDGGSPITGYTVTADGTDLSCNAAADEGSCTVTGLENLRRYTFTVRASNAVGLGEAATTSEALPHSDEFQVWLPQGPNVAKDGATQIWVFGAKGAQSVTIQVGTQSFNVDSVNDGLAVLDYRADAGSFGVRSGRLRIAASAVLLKEDGSKQTVRASSNLLVPRTTVRGKWRTGTTVKVRTRTVAPGTELAYVLGDQDMTFSAGDVCTTTADERGRATCAFEAPDEGDYVVYTVDLAKLNPGIDINDPEWPLDAANNAVVGANPFTVVAGRRSIR